MVHRIPPGPGSIPPVPVSGRWQPAAAPEGFAEALSRAAEKTAAPLRVSAHAELRLRERPLSSGDLHRVAAAVDRAAQKGARDSLVVMGDLALVISVQNRTVVTAVTGDRLRDNVFTRIDSAVILPGE